MKMDKTLRNVIIFAAIILVIAAAFTVTILTRQNSGSNSITQTAQNTLSNNANTANTQTNTATNGEVQNVKLSVSGGTYILTPSVLRKDIPVRMEADMATLKGCSRSVVIAAFGVRKTLTDSDNLITFTPTQTGTINIACSMNMYRGTFTVQ
jgi:plastocyanin domain-containing protein